MPGMRHSSANAGCHCKVHNRERSGSDGAARDPASGGET